MSFQQGLSGLNAASKNLEVIGNNVANANTYGAKASRAEFGDMYAAALSGAGSSNVGIGVNVQAVTQQFSQGSITTTANSLDIAINGAGFFEVSNNGQTQYTRNGQFQINKDGYLVNNQGLKLLGYPADNQGVIQPGQANPLQLPTAGIEPNMTTKIDMEMNLDSRAGATIPTDPAAPKMNFKDATTYNNATGVTVFDAKGQDVSMAYYFQKTGTDTWNVYATANGQSIMGSNEFPEPVTTINFPSSGGTPTSPTGAVTFDIPASKNASNAETLAITGVKLDVTKATQYGSSFGVTNLKQDGYAPGQLSGLSIDKGGVVMATYSNGQSKPAGQIELSTFRNVQGLKPLGNNVWERTYASGDAIVGTPGQGNMGVLQAGALEDSNVDLTGELVNMITAQRVYQANAQTIKTQDQVLQTLVNLR